MDYEWLCGLKPSSDTDEISFEAFQQLPDVHQFTWVDLRMPHEQPRLKEGACLEIPLQELEQRVHELGGKPVLFFCQSGKRSLQATTIYKRFYQQARVFSLSNGVLSIVQ
jgi:adenylyltransferase/sulfurtransferase